MIPVEFWAERRPHYENPIALHIIQRLGHGAIGVAKPLTFESHDGNYLVHEPALSFKMGEAQQLMDELWRCGLRPTEGAGSAGSLAATERHLADMRALVFNTEAPKP